MQLLHSTLLSLSPLDAVAFWSQFCGWGEAPLIGSVALRFALTLPTDFRSEFRPIDSFQPTFLTCLTCLTFVQWKHL